MSIYTQGVMDGGPVILCDGLPLTPEEIVQRLNGEVSQRVLETTLGLPEEVFNKALEGRTFVMQSEVQGGPTVQTRLFCTKHVKPQVEDMLIVDASLFKAESMRRICHAGAVSLLCEISRREDSETVDQIEAAVIDWCQLSGWVWTRSEHGISILPPEPVVS